MHCSSASPSVLSQGSSSASPETPHTPIEAMEAFGISTFPASESSTAQNRRQRISMACQYCRHRKIRCCGSSPCRNCTRAHRLCDYTPVPEEVNKATREKKALAKANKNANSQHLPSPISNYSPYYVDTPVFEVPYSSVPMRPAHLGHRRSVSTPNFDTPAYTPPAAPALNSPAMFESSTWMYNNWSSAPPIPTAQPLTPLRAFPSVLEQAPLSYPQPMETQPQFLSSPVQATQLVPPQIFIQTDYPMAVEPCTPQHSRSPSVESVEAPHPAWATPQYLHPAQMPTTPMALKYGSTASVSPPDTPMSSYYTPNLYSTPQYQPQPFLYSPSPLGQATYSPTLAPELPIYQKDPLVGLGIGMPNAEMEMYYTPQLMSDEYFASPSF